MRVLVYSTWSVERTHDVKAHRRKTVQMQPVQLRLHCFWKVAATHEEAHWGENIQVQPLRQNFQMEL